MMGLFAAVVLFDLNQIQYQPRYVIGTEFENGLSASAFGLREFDLQRLEASAWMSVTSKENAFQPTNAKELARKLRLLSDRIIGSIPINEDGRAYMLCYVIASWTRVNMRYLDAGEGRSHTGVSRDGSIIRFEERGKWINLEEFLRCASLEGACRHSAVLVRELLRIAGSDLKIEPHYLGGWARGLSGPLPKDTPPTHAWNYVKFSSGLHVVFDATGTTRSREEWVDRSRKLWPSPEPIWVIPRSREELENFFAFRYGTMVDGWFEPADNAGVATRSMDRLRRDPRQCLFMKMTLATWLSTDNRFIKPLNDYVFTVAVNRAKSSAGGLGIRNKYSDFLLTETR